MQKEKPGKKQAEWEFSDLPSFQSLVQTTCLPTFMSQVAILEYLDKSRQTTSSTTAPPISIVASQQLEQVEQQLSKGEAKVNQVYEHLQLLSTQVAHIQVTIEENLFTQTPEVSPLPQRILTI